ncbi:MAG: hypothetical protein ABSE68_02060 [Minisyncoccia bacterium]
MKNRNWILWSVLIFIAVAGILWLNIEKIILSIEMNSPLPKQWAAVQLTDGEILYGQLAGVTSATLGLKNVFSLEKLTSLSPENNATSTNFSVTGVISRQSEPKLIPMKKTDMLFINRTSVLYWKFLDPSDPAYSYLN